MTTGEHIDSLNPQKRDVFCTFITRVKAELGYNCVIVTSYRSLAYQDHLHKINPKNSTPGLSAHNYGFAIDCNFIRGNDHLKKSSPKDAWIRSGIIAIANECGLRWGGEFATYYDPVHFDCVKPGFTQKWFAYLKQMYPNNWFNVAANKINWKFYTD